MEERLQEILMMCSSLYEMAMLDTSIDKMHGGITIKIRKKEDSTFYVGCETGSSNDHGGGCGATIEAAARDWRSKLVAQLKSTVVRNEQYKAWMAERGLLG